MQYFNLNIENCSQLMVLELWPPKLWDKCQSWKWESMMNVSQCFFFFFNLHPSTLCLFGKFGELLPLLIHKCFLAKPQNHFAFLCGPPEQTFDFALFWQVWGESGARVHLPAACEATGCWQKHGDLRAHRQPHRGSQHLLTHLEGGRLPVYWALWECVWSTVLGNPLHVSVPACRCHTCSPATAPAWGTSTSCTGWRTSSWWSSSPLSSPAAQWSSDQPDPTASLDPAPSIYADIMVILLSPINTYLPLHWKLCLLWWIAFIVITKCLINSHSLCIRKLIV